jgi:hypothetical protein
MKITDIIRTDRKEPAVHGESTVTVPHWDFRVNDTRCHAFPHYSGVRLIVSVMHTDGKYYTLGKDSTFLSRAVWSDLKNDHVHHMMPHTTETEWLNAVNYDDANTLWGMLGKGNIIDPLDQERADNTPWMKGDDQPE